MGNVAIRVEVLGKKYHIGALQKKQDRLGDQLVDTFAAPFRRVGKLLRGQATGAAELDETIWALKDVSFEIKHGEVVGIIGRNGAGKSTLLKVLSKITDPSAGYVDMYGRVGSLLEVGTGFHPELTGRENVFLNGAILGMGRSEIERKFDEIVDFAGIEKFIDTPVKHYSSGMHVRLAFSVAAHLEPEILLVDEVLAVGDVAFQRKCLGKMEDVAEEGRTVLFVSHNMGLMQTLCQRGLLLQDGSIIVDSDITGTVEAYLQTLEQTTRSQNISERTDRKGNGDVRLVDAEFTNPDNGLSVLKTGDPVRFVLRTDTKIPNMACQCFFYDLAGQPLMALRSNVVGSNDVANPELGSMFICDVDSLLLVPGRYRVDISLTGDGVWQDFLEGALFLDVGPGHIDGRPETPNNKFKFCLPHRWTVPMRS